MFAFLEEFWVGVQTGLPLAIIPLAALIGILLIVDLGRSSVVAANKKQEEIFKAQAQDILEKV